MSKSLEDGRCEAMTGDGSENRTRSRFDSLLHSRSGGLPGQSSAATSLSYHGRKGKMPRAMTVNLTKSSRSLSAPESEGEKEMDNIKLILKPYKGDLFGNSGKDNTEGLLYLSRLDPSIDPKKIHLKDSEEFQQSSINPLDLKGVEDIVAKEEARHAAAEERRRRLAISLATLSRKPKKRVKVVGNGGIAVLAKLCCSRESSTRFSCAQAFNNLATDEDLRQRMMELGATSTIIALANSSKNNMLRSECLEALCKLAAVPGSEAKIIAEGGISCILTVQRKVPSLREVCLKILVNLSCWSGPVEPKADELNDAALLLATKVDADERLEKLLVQLLYNLSGFKNNQQRLVEEGAIRIIARAAKRTTSVDVARLCASTLCNFAGDGRARPNMLDNGTSQALLELTKHQDVGVRMEVAHTVARLVVDASCREKILKDGIVDTLVATTTSPDADISSGRYIALAYRALSSDVKFAQIVVDGGAIEGLIAFTRSPDKSSRLSCAQSLCNLIRLGIRLDCLIERGLVSALVRMVDPGDEKTSECCAAALYQLFFHPIVLTLVDGEEIIRALLDLCWMGNTSIRKYCVGAIWNMTNVEQASPDGERRAWEGIPVLLGLLQTESDRELKADCAATLYNLARNQANCEAMIVAGAVLPIAVLANKGSLETRTQCVSILQRMLLGQTIPDEIMTKSFVRTLLELSKIDDRDTQQRVVIAAYRISCYARGRELLLEEGAPESLIRLMSKPSEEMRKGCANALLNLGSDAGREMEIVECGATSVLLVTALVASNSEKTRHACTKALINLLCEKQAHHSMFRDGALWGLSSMSRTKDVAILRLCSVTLCNLSCEYWKDIAMSNVVKTVYDLASSEDETVMAAGVKTLHNVLLRAQDMGGLDHIFSSTVYIAGRALEHASKDIRLVGLRLTILVSTSAASRETAMNHDMLNLVDVMDFTNDEPLSYSFCCVLERFALDPVTRSSVLDLSCFASFTTLCSMSARILERLTRFVYVVSCSPKHVVRLVLEHDCVIRVAKPVVDTRGVGVVGWEPPNGAKDFCAALLFNLSTQDEVKAELVLKGAIRLAFMLWEGADPAIRRNCSLVACNLAVGKVNTAKMVQHGAGQLLVQLVATTDPEEDADARKRASAAFRNLLCASGNYAQLAREGAALALIDLAETGCPVVRRNCASAMRSMTCKAEIRQFLIASGAIEVILDDANNQDDDYNLVIDNKLLCELEAESWINGTRGILVESRAPPLPMLQQNCSLLPANIDDRREVTKAKVMVGQEGEEDDELYRMPWQKLQALDVALQEPDMMISTKEVGAQRIDDLGMVAAVLPEDSGTDGLEGLVSLIGVPCGKLEPKEKPEWAAVVPQEGAGDGNSLSSSISSISSIGDKGSTRAKKHVDPEIKASLETAPEVDYESSIDDGFLEAGFVRQGGEASTRTEDIRSSAALTGCESSTEQADNRARSTEIKRKSVRERDRQRTSDLHRQAKVGRGHRRGMDWEVAVVMGSKDAIDTVHRYQQRCKDFSPARRGAVNMRHMSAQRRKTAALPYLGFASPTKAVIGSGSVINDETTAATKKVNFHRQMTWAAAVSSAGRRFPTQMVRCRPQPTLEYQLPKGRALLPAGRPGDSFQSALGLCRHRHSVLYVESAAATTTAPGSSCIKSLLVASE